MKYLKKFESNKRLSIGYYVLCNENINIVLYENDETNNFVNNNIGKYIGYEKSTDNPYKIEYENIPEELLVDFEHENITNRRFRYFSRQEIVFYSKYKEDVEAFIDSKKYNL